MAVSKAQVQKFFTPVEKGDYQPKTKKEAFFLSCESYFNPTFGKVYRIQTVDIGATTVTKRTQSTNIFELAGKVALAATIIFPLVAFIGKCIYRRNNNINVVTLSEKFELKQKNKRLESEKNELALERDRANARAEELARKNSQHQRDFKHLKGQFEADVKGLNQDLANLYQAHEVKVQTLTDSVRKLELELQKVNTINPGMAVDISHVEAERLRIQEELGRAREALAQEKQLCEGEITKLQVAIQQKEAAVLSLKQELKNLQRKNRNINDLYGDCININSNLTNTVSDQTGEISELEAEKSRLQEEIQLRIVEITQLQAAIQQREDELQAQDANFHAQLARQQQAHEEQVSSLLREVVNKDQELEQTERAAYENKKRLLAEKDEQEKERIKLQQDFERAQATLAQLQMERNDLKNRLKKLEVDFAGNQQRLQEALQARDIERGELQEQRKENDVQKLKMQAEAAKIQQLTEDLELAKKTQRETQEKFRELQITNSTLSSSDSREKTLRSDLAEQRKATDALNRELSQARVEAQDLRQKLLDEKNQHEKNLQKAQHTSVDEKTALTKQLENQLALLQSQIKQLEQDLARITQQTALQKQKDSESLSKASEEKTQMELQVEAIQRELKAVQEKLALKQQKIKEMEDLIENLRKKENAFDAIDACAFKEEEVKVKAIETRDHQIKDLQANHEKAQAELAANQNAIKEKAELITKLKGRIDELNTEINKINTVAKTNNDEASILASKMKNQIAILEANLQTTKEEFETYKRDTERRQKLFGTDSTPVQPEIVIELNSSANQANFINKVLNMQ
jgi:chromosome segregation ATPase